MSHVRSEAGLVVDDRHKNSVSEHSGDSNRSNGSKGRLVAPWLLGATPWASQAKILQPSQTFVIAVKSCQRCACAVLHVVLLFRSQRGCAVCWSHITSVNASAKGNLRAGPGLATGLQTKKLDGLCLGFYCPGVPRGDVIGTEAAGVKDWVGKGFMRGPTGLPHAYRETTFDCFKSGKTPREKRSRGRGQKHAGSLHEGEAPLPDWPALAFAGGERQFPRAQEERPF